MLRSLADYEWFEEGDDPETIDSKLKHIVSEIDSHEELLYASIAKTWSFEEEDLWFLLNHKLCDFGLALRFYWMCQPYFFYRQIERGNDFSEIEQKEWAGIKKLEERLLENFYEKREVYCSPEEIYGKPIKDDDPYNPGMKLIPTELRIVSEGENIKLEFNEIFR